MVITKVFQIKNGNKLAQGLDYINDKKKITIFSKINYNTEDIEEILKKKISYIKDIKKTKEEEIEEVETDFFVNEKGEKTLVSCHGLLSPETSFDEMKLTKQEANNYLGRDKEKPGSVLAHHIIQSFSPDDKLTPEEVHEIGRKTVLELTKGEHEFVIATHMDKAHLHNHIIFNTTNNITLKKFRWKKGTKKSLEHISDKHADMYGAKILKREEILNHKKYSAYKQKDTIREEIREKIKFLLKNSSSLKDFVEKLEILGIEIDPKGQEIKYKLKEKSLRWIRSKSLSKKGYYSLKNINKKIKENKEFLLVKNFKTDNYKDENKTGKITDSEGKAVEGIENKIYKNINEAPKELQNLLEKEGIKPKGAFQLFSVKDKENFFKNYVEKGKTLTITTPMQVKRNYVGNFKNKAYQIDFGNTHKNETNIKITEEEKIPGEIELFYNLTWDFDQYKDIDPPKEEINKGFYYIDDNLEQGLFVSKEEIKDKYKEFEEEKEDEYEIKFIINKEQIEAETKNGIYIKINFGIRNQGTILIYHNQADKLENGNYEIFLKKTDFFYFINEKHSEENKYITANTLAKQLTEQSGEILITKNRYIDKIDILLKELNFLSENKITNKDKYKKFKEELNLAFKKIEKELDRLDGKISKLNKIHAVLNNKEESKQNLTEEILEKLKIRKDINKEELEKIIKDIRIERNILQKKVEEIIKKYDYTKKIEKNIKIRNENKKL